MAGKERQIKSASSSSSSSSMFVNKTSSSSSSTDVTPPVTVTTSTLMTTSGVSEIVKRGSLYIKRPPSNNPIFKLRAGIQTWQKRYLVLRDSWTPDGDTVLELYGNEALATAANDPDNDLRRAERGRGEVIEAGGGRGGSGGRDGGSGGGGGVRTGEVSGKGGSRPRLSLVRRTTSMGSGPYVINLRIVTGVDVFTESKTFRNAFVVFRIGKSPIIFGAKTELEMREWLMAIKLVSDKVNNHIEKRQQQLQVKMASYNSTSTAGSGGITGGAMNSLGRKSQSNSPPSITDLAIPPAVGSRTPDSQARRGMMHVLSSSRDDVTQPNLGTPQLAFKHSVSTGNIGRSEGNPAGVGLAGGGSPGAMAGRPNRSSPGRRSPREGVEGGGRGGRKGGEGDDGGGRRREVLRLSAAPSRTDNSEDGDEEEVQEMFNGEAEGDREREEGREREGAWGREENGEGDGEQEREVSSFLVQVQPTPDAEKNGLSGDIWLVVSRDVISLRPTGSDDVIISWPLEHIARLKTETASDGACDVITLQASSKAGLAGGLYFFRSSSGSQFIQKVRQFLSHQSKFSNSSTVQSTTTCRRQLFALEPQSIERRDLSTTSSTVNGDVSHQVIRCTQSVVTSSCIRSNQELVSNHTTRTLQQPIGRDQSNNSTPGLLQTTKENFRNRSSTNELNISTNHSRPGDRLTSGRAAGPAPLVASRSVNSLFIQSVDLNGVDRGRQTETPPRPPPRPPHTMY